MSLELIETAKSMALCSKYSMACYTDRSWQIRLLYGSDQTLLEHSSETVI